jgi:hypothetical protein
MTTLEAAKKLEEQLHCGPGGEDEGVFIIKTEGDEIVVDVNFIYRLKEVPQEIEGFRVITGKGRGRVSCW